MAEQRTAPHDLHGIDGEGVRRRVRAGDRIPPGLILEEELDTSGDEPDESKRLRQEKADRAATTDDAATTTAGSVGGAEETAPASVVEGDGSQTTPKPRARRGRSSS